MKQLFSAQYTVFPEDLDHRSQTRGPHGCIMWVAATFVNCVYTVKLHNNLGYLVYPFAVYFPTWGP
jgi:hypothetical protein